MTRAALARYAYGEVEMVYHRGRYIARPRYSEEDRQRALKCDVPPGRHDICQRRLLAFYGPGNEWRTPGGLGVKVEGGCGWTRRLNFELRGCRCATCGDQITHENLSLTMGGQVVDRRLCYDCAQAMISCVAGWMTLHLGEASYDANDPMWALLSIRWLALKLQRAAVVYARKSTDGA